jgi:hypothetical protein
MPATPAKKVGQSNGFDFYIPTSGGKAGAGNNVTSTIQIRQGSQVVKQIRFKLDDPDSRKRAMQRALVFTGTPTRAAALAARYARHFQYRDKRRQPFNDGPQPANPSDPATWTPEQRNRAAAWARHEVEAVTKPGTLAYDYYPDWIPADIDPREIHGRIVAAWDAEEAAQPATAKG